MRINGIKMEAALRNQESANAAKLLTQIGMEVILIDDRNKAYATKLRKMPWQLGHGAWVAEVEGSVSCWCCTRILPMWTAKDISQ